MSNDVKATLKLNYTIYTAVKRVWEDHERRYVSGHGYETVFEKVSKGWFVAFEGSYEALYFGSTRPHFEEGDKVKITFERTADAQPSKPPIK